jgi:hypothetical protein
MTTISTRRFIRRFASLTLATNGWNSAYPAAERRLGSTPCSVTKNFTTAVARSDESSQLLGIFEVYMARSSVWPSTAIWCLGYCFSTDAMSVRISRISFFTFVSPRSKSTLSVSKLITNPRASLRIITL